MTRLLVSVRNAGEAEIALSTDVDLIDLKEPRKGSLGAVEPGVVTEVAALTQGRVPLSVACGELLDFCAHADSAIAANIGDYVQNADYWKLGLAGCADLPKWDALWRAVANQAGGASRAVAVIYADWRIANAPRPRDVLKLAVEAGCAGVLVDTWSKDGRGLFDHWPLDRVQRFIRAVQGRCMFAAVAGSLDRPAIQKLLPLAPDVIAVRGAACDGDRNGGVSELRIRRLVDLLRSAPRSAADAESRLRRVTQRHAVE